MTYSMTGYGKAAEVTAAWSIDVEIKSVNNRYLDLKIRAPQPLNFMEMAIKSAISDKLHRGHVDCNIHFRALDDAGSVTIHERKLAKLVEAFRAFQLHNGVDCAMPMDSFVRMDGIVEIESGELDEAAVREAVLAVLDRALNTHVESRQVEGERLKRSLIEKNEAITSAIEAIKRLSPELMAHEQARLKENLEALLGDEHPVDPHLLANELACIAQRIDIDEEIVRLSGHISAFYETLNRDEPVGKTLDFYIQEMNREVNTISSKSNDINLRTLCVNLKTTIEQLREQIQNIE